jgi:hypothetical protein
MKFLPIFALAFFAAAQANAASFTCTAGGKGQKTVDSFTVVKMEAGPNATLEFHVKGKSIALSPTGSADRGDRAHRPQDVEPKGTAEYVPETNMQELNIGLANDPKDPPFVSAIFVSQGLLQDKGSGYVTIEYRYAEGSGAAMHARHYDCE